MDYRAVKDVQTGRFIQGGPRGGRTKGARNKLQADVIMELLDHWHSIGTTKMPIEEMPRGRAAIEIVYRENPRDYLKIVTSVLPKEYRIEDERFANTGDEELGQIIEAVSSEIERRLYVIDAQPRSASEGAKRLPGRAETTPERE